MWQQNKPIPGIKPETTEIKKNAGIPLDNYETANW